MGTDKMPLRAVRVIENEWITLADGCRLAARIWLPEDAAQNPVPVILEYLPYRKRDGTAPRDEINHSYQAARGYAVARVDIRGNGESEGLMEDEYTAQELADGAEVIKWLAAQPWCTGAAGMMGISWGGFNALQVAALRPPALKAIVTVCSLDDRYAGDTHYRGGCLLGDNLTWSSQMLAYSARPPDPALVGDKWREMWLSRLDAMPLLAANWLGIQRREPYWRHGSVCEDYAAIEAAVLTVGGFADPYSDTVFRLLSHLRAPCRGIVGPWMHKYPHVATPAPRIGFLHEIVRWWDYWLKGEKNGVMDTPALRVYQSENAPIAGEVPQMPGRWIGEEQWPSPNIQNEEMFLRADGLRAGAGKESALRIDSPLTVGADCGSWCPGMRPGFELPGDQRFDDALSLCFDGEPLAAPFALLGAPIVEFEFSAERPVAQIVARLCEVREDGGSKLISWMPLNLAHHQELGAPDALVPGRRYRARLRLSEAGYVFSPRRRIRLALSSAYWPMLWPAPRKAALRFFAGGARLILPRRRAAAGPAVKFAPPETGAAAIAHLRPPSSRRTIARDVGDGAVTARMETDFGAQRFLPHNLESDCTARESFVIRPDCPDSAQAEAEWVFCIGRGEWQTRTETFSRLRADADSFYLQARLNAFENGKIVRVREWDEKIARDLV